MAIGEQISEQKTPLYLQTKFVFNTLGNVVAVGVREDIFMRDYAEHFCEWIEGTVIKMSPVKAIHDKLVRYLATLIDAYLELREIGEIRQQPFVMAIDVGEEHSRRREPDIQLVLDSNEHELLDTMMDGPADLVIEVVSPESRQRDYGEKLQEYEAAGVPEYWVIDPDKRQARFYWRNAEGAYVLQEHGGQYESLALPSLKIEVATLWQDPLPRPATIARAVAEMLADANTSAQEC